MESLIRSYNEIETETCNSENFVTDSFCDQVRIFKLSHHHH